MKEHLQAAASLVLTLFVFLFLAPAVGLLIGRALQAWFGLLAKIPALTG